MPLILIPVLLLFVPAIEIVVFIKVGQAIGAWKVLALVFLSAILGAFLLRYQSIGVIRRLDRDLRQGRTPDASLFDGFLIVVGGVLLIIPGFVSDAVGLLLMIPLVRRIIRNFIKARVTVKGFSGNRGGFRRGSRPQDDVVDLSPEDFERKVPTDRPSDRPSPPTIDHRD
ncbi:FxsA family protein [Rhizobium sp.]